MLNFESIEILDAREHASTGGTNVVFVWKSEKEGDCSPLVLPELLTRALSSQEVIVGNLAGTGLARMEALAKAHKFSGNLGQILFCPASEVGEQQILFVGLGERNIDKFENLESLRNAIAKVVSSAQELSLDDLVIFIQSAQNFVVVEKFDISSVMTDLVAYLKMAAYSFEDFKSKKSDNLNVKVRFMLEGPLSDSAKVIKNGSAIGHYANFVRGLCDFPPNVATPEYVTKAVAEKVSGKSALSMRVIEQDEAKSLGMGGFCAVGSGSSCDSKFVILEYKSSNVDAKKIALVGKGVTFDTGGVSLKPADSMTGMKYDMSGAAVVLATTILACEINLPINLIAVAPLVENMPDGNSYRQDDIIKFYNGKTAEINNTDAEGRVILADALSWAEKNYSPDQIIDVATLTGACIVALGSVYAGIMGSDQELVSSLIKAGEPVGELLWQLPMHKAYAKGIESKHADISNCGARGFGAGTITAAWFLKNFVEKTPWAHLDIAGKDSMVRGSAHAHSGASGFGLRLLINYLRIKAGA